MVSRQPVLLTVLIESAAQRWYVAVIDHQGRVTPLLCSQPGNLAAYVDQGFDQQVVFLRHRLSGVLQRGCDRLWARKQKPCRIVFVADNRFPDAPSELTDRVAEHFVEWMSRPPVVFLLLTRDGTRHERLAGDWDEQDREAFEQGVPELLAAASQDQRWDVASTKKAL